jgi:predicted XRE-type DNA-binding protein
LAGGEKFDGSNFMSMSEEIREAIRNKGISLNQMAREMKAAGFKVPQPSLSRFLAGQELRSNTLDKLADYLKLRLVHDPSMTAAPPKKSAPKKSPKR